MSTIAIDIVSVDGAVYSGRATLVVADAIEGQLGIAPRHAPLLTRLVPGTVRVLRGDEPELLFYVGGGILEVQPHHVTVLADVAERGEDIDEAAALAARERAEAAVRATTEKSDLARAERELIEAAARYRVLEKFQRRRRRAGDRSTH
jgi:F-type H+-transporting ATPase subunit epsilon